MIAVLEFMKTISVIPAVIIAVLEFMKTISVIQAVIIAVLEFRKTIFVLPAVIIAVLEFRKTISVIPAVIIAVLEFMKTISVIPAVIIAVLEFMKTISVWECCNKTTIIVADNKRKWWNWCFPATGRRYEAACPFQCTFCIKHQNFQYFEAKITTLNSPNFDLATSKNGDWFLK